MCKYLCKREWGSKGGGGVIRSKMGANPDMGEPEHISVLRAKIAPPSQGSRSATGIF